MKFKLKLPKLKNFFRVILAAILTSVLISTILISLPQTEKVFKNARYDITLANPIWRKEYILELNIKPKDLNEKREKVSLTKKIIENRLKKYGVQEVQFQDLKSNERDIARVKVTVETDKDKSSVDQLISQRYYARFVTRKAGVNFEDEKNQFAQFDIANYDNTPYTLHDFREVYITKLKATTGEKSYFAIYKPWEHRATNFYEYFDRYAGQYAGLAIDGFVSPIVVPVTVSSSQSTSGVVARNPFAVGMNGSDNEAKLLGILNNTGVIPVQYTLESSKDLKVTNFNVDYIKATALFAVLSFTLIVLNYLLTQKGSFASFLSYFVTAGFVVTGLKLTQFPVQPIVAIYTAILLTTLLPFFLNSRKIIVTLGALGIVLHLLGLGYIRDVGLLLAVIMFTYLFTGYIVRNLMKLIRSIIEND
ncbi:MAG TPA: hypothetical protein PLV59_02965 [Candidatus Dojkabacteria bacterium]|mgnify:CR=1 FL=1|nr:hypothetical protein [Candidatus Dojkabacteria bacterium]